MQNELFMYSYNYADGVNVGIKRNTNQDVTICQPEIGFFAVSDGMGGITSGQETSAMIAKSLPLLVVEAYKELLRHPSPEYAADLLIEQICFLSDSIFERLNTNSYRYDYGATFCGVWLVGKSAVFVNLGDSRGYHFRKELKQITTDHNLKEKALSNHTMSENASNNILTRFVGMEKPAKPDSFICDIEVEDKLLICSDGLYKMVNNNDITDILKITNNSEIVSRMIDKANKTGGDDNISLVVISFID